MTAPAQPQARSTPRASVVLPAPRSPTRWIDHARRERTRRARRPARACRASSAQRYAACSDASNHAWLRKQWMRAHRTDFAALAARHQRVGTRARLSTRSASRTPSSARRKRACWSGSAAAGTARWIIWRATARAARAPRSSCRARVRVITARLELPARRGARDAQAVLERPDARLRLALRARPRLPQGDARAGCSSSPTASRRSSGAFGYRVFTDSAPVMEVALGAKSGPRLARQAHAAARARRGLVFLPRRDLHRPAAAGRRAAARPLRHLHALHRRLPDRAIVAPYQLDARRCISLPHHRARGSIPEALRPLIGNRIYGCDDCQLVCPWNRFAHDGGGARLRGAQRARRRARWSSSSRGRERSSTQRLAGQRDPPHRPRALAAQHRRGARQRAARRREHRRSAACAPRRSLGAGARARRVGAGATASQHERRLLTSTAPESSARVVISGCVSAARGPRHQQQPRASMLPDRARESLRPRRAAQLRSARRSRRSPCGRHHRPQSRPSRMRTPCPAAAGARRHAPASANQLVHRHDRQHDREHQHQHDRAHDHDQRRAAAGPRSTRAGSPPRARAPRRARRASPARRPVCSPLATRCTSTGGNTR